jgi:hypothetical protein
MPREMVKEEETILQFASFPNIFAGFIGFSKLGKCWN